jgi:arylsulfatase A-like enzyme
VNAPYFRDRPKREIYREYEPDGQTGLAIDFIRKRRTSSPFALFLSWGPPHDPWDERNQPPEFRERFRDVTFPLSPSYSEHSDPHADAWATLPKDYSQHVQDYQRGYYAMTSDVDRALGRLLDAIRAEGLANDTIVVFSSDHGEMFGAHGRRAKYIFYEEAARVPFLVRWPGHIAKGQSDVLLSTPDIMPTLLALMNLPVPRSVEGTDLSGTLTGRSQRGPEAAYLQGMGATAAWTDGSEWRALRTHEFTYATYHSDGSELLFNNAADPHQLKNLVDDRAHVSTLNHLREQLRRWMKQHNDEFQACTWYRDRWSVDRNITNTASGVKQDLAQLKGIVDRTAEEIRKEVG